MELFIKAFVSFLIIANPLGAAAMFVGLLAYANPQQVKATARKSVLVATGVLLAFAFFGEFILVKFGITIPAFRVAGGVLLFTIAYRMLFGDAMPEVGADDHRSFTERHDVAIFPLGIPLIAGPGCISLTIIMMSKTETVMESSMIVLGILGAMAITWASLLMARQIHVKLGPSGLNLITRVLGILLSARAVQIIADGIQGLNFHFGS